MHFNEQDKARLAQAISEAEHATSAEIRLFIEQHVQGETPLARAQALFEELEMHKTDRFSGVLVYIALADHRFALVADPRAAHRVSQTFWWQAALIFQDALARGAVNHTLGNALIQLGQRLALIYPPNQDQINELPNDVVFG
jgi:uncharacterized membrane protein